MMTIREMREQLWTLQQKPENQVCCDCTQGDPIFATIFAPPPGCPGWGIGAFFCGQCSAAHETLGGRTCLVRKNLEHSEWTPKEFDSMFLAGNRLFNSIFEGKLKINDPKPTFESGPTARDNFANVKYVERKYFHPNALKVFNGATANQQPLAALKASSKDTGYPEGSKVARRRRSLTSSVHSQELYEISDHQSNVDTSGHQQRRPRRRNSIGGSRHGDDGEMKTKPEQRRRGSIGRSSQPTPLDKPEMYNGMEQAARPQRRRGSLGRSEVLESGNDSGAPRPQRRRGSIRRSSSADGELLLYSNDGVRPQRRRGSIGRGPSLNEESVNMRPQRRRGSIGRSYEDKARETLGYGDGAPDSEHRESRSRSRPRRRGSMGGSSGHATTRDADNVHGSGPQRRRGSLGGVAQEGGRARRRGSLGRSRDPSSERAALGYGEAVPDSARPRGARRRASIGNPQNYNTDDRPRRRGSLGGSSDVYDDAPPRRHGSGASRQQQPRRRSLSMPGDARFHPPSKDHAEGSSDGTPPQPPRKGRVRRGSLGRRA